MRRGTTAAGAAAVLVAIGAADARACSLVLPPQGRSQAEVRFEAAWRVVVGRVTSVRDIDPPAADGITSSGDPVQYVVKVRRTLKGPRGRQWVRLRSARSSATCGISLRVGQTAGLTLGRRGPDGRHAVSIADGHDPDELRRIARRT